MKQEIDKELIKAMEGLGWDDIVTELVKGGSEEEETEEKEELTDEEKAEAEEAKKKEKEESDEEETEKGQKDEFNKAVDEAFGNKMNPFKDLIKGVMSQSVGLAKENEELKKSLSDVNTEMEEMKKSITEIGEMPIPSKAVGTVNVIEKGGHMEDDEANLILSTSNANHKAMIVKAMSTGLEKTNDEILKGDYENCLLGSMGSKVEISKGVVDDLRANHKIRIVREK